MNFTYSQRHKGDKLVRDDYNWKKATNVRIEGEDPGEHLGASFYPYGAMIYWGSPQHNQLEFHAQRGATPGSRGYSACFTLVAGAGYNEAQVRELGDDNAVTIGFPDRGTGDPYIGTEFTVNRLIVKPKGDLVLAPERGTIIIGSEELESLIRRIAREEMRRA